MPVVYDCTSEASDEEWNDDSRDDDAARLLKSGRRQSKQPSRAYQRPSHAKQLILLPDEIHSGLMSSKLHRVAGRDGITAEIRAVSPWLILLSRLFGNGMLSAHTWPRPRRRYDHYLYKKQTLLRQVNYRGITLLAVLGKCLSAHHSHIVWLIDFMLLDNQFDSGPTGDASKV